MQAKGDEMFAKELTIFTDKIYHDKYEAIKDIAHLQNAFVNDHDAYASAVVERENVIATYIGYGIAIPHAISAAVNQAFVIYVKFLNGCPWATEGGEEKVDHMLMIGVPADKGSTQHLKILAELSKNLMHEDFREKFLHAENPEEAYKLLKSIEKEMEV